MAKIGRPRKYEGTPPRIVAEVPPELFERFRSTVERLGRVQRHCVEEAVRDWLVKYGDAGLLK